MKRYSQGKINTIELVVDFYFHFTEVIEGTTNLCLSDEELDLVIEEVADEYYYNFMNNVEHRIESLGMEILEHVQKSSNIDSKSYYFTFCNKEDYDSLTVTLILNLRISDHRLKKRKGGTADNNRFTKRDAYYSSEKENYLMLNERHPELIDDYFFEIFISGHKFKTFRQTLNYITKVIKDEVDTL